MQQNSRNPFEVTDKSCLEWRVKIKLSISVFAAKQKTNTYKVDHRLLYDTACLPA
jgi:hypothetical protein